MKITEALMQSFNDELSKHAEYISGITKQALSIGSLRSIIQPTAAWQGAQGRGIANALGGTIAGTAVSLPMALSGIDTNKSFSENAADVGRAVGTGALAGAGLSLLSPSVGRAGWRGLYGITGRNPLKGGRAAIYDPATSIQHDTETLPGLARGLLRNPGKTIRGELKQFASPGTDGGGSLHKIMLGGMALQSGHDVYHGVAGELDPGETRGSALGRAVGNVMTLPLGMRLPGVTSMAVMPLVSNATEAIGRAAGSTVGV